MFLVSVWCSPNSECTQPNKQISSRTVLIGFYAGNQTRPYCCTLNRGRTKGLISAQFLFLFSYYQTCPCVATGEKNSHALNPNNLSTSFFVHVLYFDMASHRSCRISFFPSHAGGGRGARVITMHLDVDLRRWARPPHTPLLNCTSAGECLGLYKLISLSWMCGPPAVSYSLHLVNTSPLITIDYSEKQKKQYQTLQ